MKTIDCTPSWVNVVRIYIEVLNDTSSSNESKKLAKEEIIRCALIADKYIFHLKNGEIQSELYDKDKTKDYE